MRWLRVNACAQMFVLAFMLASPAVVADFVTVTRDTANIRQDPFRDSAFVVTAARGDQFALLDNGQQENGYYHVNISEMGQDGWIYRNRVRRTAGPLPGTGPSLAEQHVFGGLPDVSALNEVIDVLTNAGYAVAYSEFRLNPVWSAYHLEGATSGSCPRRRTFLMDSRTNARVVHGDYTNTGYDRGHMAPSASIGGRFGCPAQNETFRLSNIAPQLPTLNQETWEALERRVSDLALQFGTISVITGPIYAATDPQFLCGSGIEVPIAFYKILVRDTQPPRALALVMDQNVTGTHQVSEFVTTIDTIETQTGIDFFTSLTDPVEHAMESAQPSPEWGLDHSLVPTFDGRPRTLCTVPADELPQ